jgi:hypothetical protein
MTTRGSRPGVDGDDGSAEVVSITARAGARAVRKRQAAGYIASARAVLGMTHAEYADYLAGPLGWRPAPGAVERWEQAGNPPADALLESQAVTGGIPAGFGAVGGDAVRPYSGRGLISREQWNEIISGAGSHLWLYGMAEFGYATDDEVPAILAEAAGAGCDVRVLLLDPDCPAAVAVDADEGSPPGTLPARIRASLARFTAMRDDCPAIKIRVYDTHPTVSIVRGDESMLVTPYLRYFLGGNSPTFALTEQSAPGLFARWGKHFESMWNNSREQD